MGRSFQIPVSASLLEGLEDVRVESEDGRVQIPEWCNERGVSIKSLIAVSAWINGMFIIHQHAIGPAIGPAMCAMRAIGNVSVNGGSA